MEKIKKNILNFPSIICIYTSIAFLFFGHIGRVFSVNNLSLNVFELALYLAAIFKIKYLRYFKPFLFFLLIFDFLSVFNNLISLSRAPELQDTIGWFYLIRFNLIFFSALVFAKVTYDFIGFDVKKLQQKIIFYFMINIFISLILYIYFPSSNDLWAFAKSLNIIIEGDPHNYRLVSLLFDPNYYSLMLLLPISFILSNNIYSGLRGNILFILFFSCLILTGSRNGILTFIIFFFAAFIKSKFNLKYFLYFSGAAFGTIIFYKNFHTFIERTIYYFHYEHFYEENRINNFYYVLENILLNFKYLFYGHGFHFGTLALKEHDLLSFFDCSYLILIYDFGVIQTLILLFITFVFVNKLLNSSFKKYEISKFISSIKIYYLILFLFSSFFINTFFYIYITFTFLFLLAYIYIIKNETKI